MSEMTSFRYWYVAQRSVLGRSDIDFSTSHKLKIAVTTILMNS